ncbi:hypothetical protein B9Z55_007014 [Caenorhabditis nigoni]|uniref:Uncharacterized protein n=1 Tax=Caenorhabditis nigoni TaxID=1611254 RepID=A0A2G5V8D7_9PELO|nr:hypothetical protein B9Z55_007014 [Caenorhabditis nigoni]
MFIRLAPFLFLLALVNSLKIQNILKDLGKRYVSDYKHLSAHDFNHAYSKVLKQGKPGQGRGYYFTNYGAWEAQTPE